MMNKIYNYKYRKLFLLAAFLICGSLANAQLPNEKFGKPSKEEWEFTGWDDAPDAAVALVAQAQADHPLPLGLGHHWRQPVPLHGRFHVFLFPFPSVGHD